MVTRPKCLQLTEEEALGLLDVAMACPTDLSSEQYSAVMKLSDFCRELLRDARQHAEEALVWRTA